MTPEQEQYRDEAERLAQLPRQDQAAVVEMYRHLASNPLATQVCRDGAVKKVASLEKLLGLKRPKTQRPKEGKTTAKGR